MLPPCAALPEAVASVAQAHLWAEQHVSNGDGNTWVMAMMALQSLIWWKEEAGPKSIASEGYERQNLSYRRLKRSIYPQRME